jgi:hypothetical protein
MNRSNNRGRSVWNALIIFVAATRISRFEVLDRGDDCVRDALEVGFDAYM